MASKRLISSLVLAMSISLASSAQAYAPIHRLAPKKVVSLAKINPKLYALKVLTAKGLGLSEFKCLINIGVMESHWNSKAYNSTPVLQNGKWLHAYGIGQLITETSHDPAQQIRNFIRYTEYRYGSPCKAWAFWQRKSWY